jgi:hypothetical protein
MTAKKPVESVEEVLVRVENEDPWKEMVTVTAPLSANRKDDTEWVCVNGRTFSFPKGQPIEVPRPVAEVLNNRIAAETAAAEAKKRMANK